EARPWPREPRRVRRAGVSSFGVSGTNVHVVLEEAPSPSGTLPAGGGALAASYPLLRSGRDERALRAQAERGVEWVSTHSDAAWSDVVRTAALRRTHFDARAAIQASGLSEASEALRALAAGESHPAVSVGQARQRGGVVLVFSGQGSQWPA